MSAPKLTWQWDHERERYAGQGEHDYVDWTLHDDGPYLWAGNTEEPETCLDAEVVVPVSAVLAALIRAFGRETVVAWAQQAQLEPGDQVDLFVEVET